MDDVFRALADPTRRQLLDRLNARNGQSLSELCAGLDATRQTITKHIQILEHAHLIVSSRRGREKFHYLNAAPIQDISARWIGHYQQRHATALAALKGALETPSMNTTDSPTTSFVYTTYIRTTPEKLWTALTSPEFTRQYWNMEFETDWQPGSPMIWRHHGVTINDPEQVVLEADPFRRLSYTWHTFTDELADHFQFADDVREQLNSEPRSVATFDIEDRAPIAKLTVTHERLLPEGTTITMISHGWPDVIAGLKTLLETGQPIGDA